MLIVIVAAVFALLSTVVAVWDKLTSGVRSTLILGIILIVIAVGSQSVQVYEKKVQLGKESRQQDTINEQQRTIEDANLLNNSNLIDLDEASGGATWNGLGYLVDDSEPKIFVFKYAESEYEYKPHSKSLDITDDHPCKGLDWPEPCTPGTATTLSKKSINDLEGAAIDRNGNLFLTTSHSYAKGEDSGKPDPARAVFLRTSLDGHVLNATRKLREIIGELFKNKLNGIANSPVPEYKNEAGKLEVMQIEGLAIDRNNRIYLGFRAPLVDDQYALVLRASAEQIFTDNPQFESFLLDLRQPDGSKYGIVSLDYDAQNDRIIVLGNSIRHYTTCAPVIWSWEVGDPKVIQSTSKELAVFNGEIFSLKSTPGIRRAAKPEVVLIPKPDRIHLFFDAQGTGGQLDLIREGLNLKRIRKTGIVFRPAEGKSCGEKL